MRLRTIVNATLCLYAFCRKEDMIVGIPLSSAEVKNGVLEVQVVTLADQIGGSSYCFEQLGGLIFYLSDDKYFGSEWEDRALSFKTFRMIEENDEKPKVEKIENKRESEGESITEWKAEQEAKIEDECEGELEIAEEKSIGLFEVTDPFVPYTLPELFDHYHYISIQNFVLHAYRRFGHLGLRETKNGYLIGVPGIYCKSEEAIAKRSGFYQFYPQNGGTLHYGDFGYWYTNMEYRK
ncbi:MAG: hypothetical protein PWP24_1739 [Clostridiales bacterium]|nr:hypothetical protein [Clostridiales bacterium]